MRLLVDSNCNTKVVKMIFEFSVINFIYHNSVLLDTIKTKVA